MMKILVAPQGRKFGPFDSIVEGAAGWNCDGCEYPRAVIGAASVADWDGQPLYVPPKTREQLKAERQAAVDAIRVTTSTGKTFDGDETSQTRMARAIVGMQAAQAPSIVWVLADNTPAQVTVAELTEALILAGQAQADVWVIS